MPLYLTYPKAINGTDTAMHIHDVASLPNLPIDKKYVTTETAIAASEKRTALLTVQKH